MRPPRGGSLALVVVLLSGTVLAGGATPAAARTRSGIEFRPVLTALPSVASNSPTTTPGDVKAAKATVASCDVDAVAQLAVIPTTSPLAAGDACVVFPDQPGGRLANRYYLGPAALTGRAIDHAKPQFLAGQGWTVRIELTNAGSKAWDRLAEAQFHRQVAITALVVAAPTIQPDTAKFESFGGVAVVSGRFTEKQAVALAALANAGRG